MDEKQFEALLAKSNADLKSQFEKPLGELKAAVDKCNEDMKHHGTVSAASLETLEKVQQQVDAIDEKQQAVRSAPEGKTLADTLKESEDVQRLLKDGKGRAIVKIPWSQVKTTITSGNIGTTPSQTTGVLSIERDSGITSEARRRLLLRNVISSRPTSRQVIDFVKVANAMADAQSQSPEGGAKYENAITFVTASEQLKTIATWIPASKQIIRYMDELEAFLRQSLRYYVEKETEDQLLNGNGAGQTLRGLIPQATAFNTALLPAAAVGWTAIDIIGAAAAQIAIADEIPPSFVVLNPANWWMDLRLVKDANGRYIFANPWSSGVPNLFDMTPVVTTAIAADTFLVGSGDPAATEIRTGMELTVDISTEHSDYFTKNLVAIRAEQELALVTKRPASFITGSLTTSPA